MTLVADATSHF